MVKFKQIAGKYIEITCEDCHDTKIVKTDYTGQLEEITDFQKEIAELKEHGKYYMESSMNTKYMRQKKKASYRRYADNYFKQVKALEIWMKEHPGDVAFTIM